MSDLITGLAELASAQDDCATADKYATGSQKEIFFTTQRLANRLSRIGARFRMNFAGQVIKAVKDRLEITQVTSADSRAARALEILWDFNGMDIEQDDVHDEALRYGETYVMVWPDENGVPTYYLNPPTQMRIVYDAANPRRKKFAIKWWEEKNAFGMRVHRANLLYDDRIERFISQDENGKEWERYVEDDDEGVIENPYGVIPVFHFRTGRPHGRPEHLEAYGAQDAINKLVVTQMATTDSAGFPQRYGLMSDAAISGGSGWDDDEDEIDVVSGTRPEELKASPGDIQILRNLREVGQFAVSDVEHFLKPYKVYVSAISALCSTPMHLFEGMGDVPSGESLRAANAPLDKKVGNHKLSFGGTWKDLNEFALLILGINAEVRVVWADHRQVDDAEAWETAKLKIEAGIPREVVYQEMGYTPEIIASWSTPTPGADAGPSTATAEDSTVQEMETV